MLKTFFELLIIYTVLKVCLIMHIFTYTMLQEFGCFCILAFLLFIASRFSLKLRDHLYSKE